MYFVVDDGYGGLLPKRSGGVANNLSRGLGLYRAEMRVKAWFEDE